MTKPIPYPYRMSITASTDQRKALDNLIPWGSRDRLLGKMLDLLIDLLEKSDDPYMIVGAIMAGHLQFKVKEDKDGSEKH
jgi:hypothetical protein